ncbi:S-adenosylmethionine decarboxylase [Xylariomycetidae sp. FL2044]|nr:S-adenosylmethionine decarboxylase [Xylariomycetidae sp. FL2044]
MVPVSLAADHMDAYLLSESSMFVFLQKLILKICGTTTLLLGLHRLLRIAAEHAGFPFHNASSLEGIHAAASPYRVFYSRKNFLFPDKYRARYSVELRLLLLSVDGSHMITFRISCSDDK